MGLLDGATNFHNERSRHLIQLPRSQLKDIRAVFSRCLSDSLRGPVPTVTFSANNKGLTVRSLGHDAAAKWRLAGEYERLEFTVPFAALKQCEGGKSQQVAFSVSGDLVTAEFTEKNSAESLQWEADTAADLPAAPRKMQKNEPRLLAALRDAADTTDKESHRFAFGCMQLQGVHGRIAATDASQLLVQDGFQFPWKDAPLIPARKVFACRQLPTDETIEIGKIGDWVCIRVGPWTLHFHVFADGKFPVVESLIGDASLAETTLHVTDADAEFFSQAVQQLPGAKNPRSPVAVDLNGAVAIRAVDEEGEDAPSELVLSNSIRTGDKLSLSTDRRFLARALQLGFRDVHFRGPESPTLCCDDHRSYVWALLSGGQRSGNGQPVVRFESPLADTPETKPQPTSQPRRKRTSHMPRKRSPDTNGEANAKTETESAASLTLIERAEGVRDSLQQSLTLTRELITLLKRQKKASKLVQSTLASLRQLQGVDA